MKTSVRHYFFAFVLACAIVAGIAHTSLGTGVPNPQLVAAAERTPDTGASRGSQRLNNEPPVEAVDPVAASQSQNVQEHGTEQGVATYYTGATGARGCTHMTAPVGATLTVRNTATGGVVQCVVVDRGPYLDERIVALDTNIFSQLAPLGQTTFPAEVTW